MQKKCNENAKLLYRLDKRKSILVLIDLIGFGLFVSNDNFIGDSLFDGYISSAWLFSFFIIYRAYV